MRGTVTDHSVLGLRHGTSVRGVIPCHSHRSASAHDTVMILEFQERIRLSMRGGGSFHDVEEKIIDRSGLDQDQKAALWLYAWSFVPRRTQRAEATRLAAYLDGGR